MPPSYLLRDVCEPIKFAEGGVLHGVVRVMLSSIVRLERNVSSVKLGLLYPFTQESKRGLWVSDGEDECRGCGARKLVGRQS